MVPEVGGSRPLDRPISPLQRDCEAARDKDGQMTAFWNESDFDDHEQVVFVRDAASGLSGIIAIHSTHLGPAAGGTRFWH